MCVCARAYLTENSFPVEGRRTLSCTIEPSFPRNIRFAYYRERQTNRKGGVRHRHRHSHTERHTAREREGEREGERARARERERVRERQAQTHAQTHVSFQEKREGAHLYRARFLQMCMTLNS